MLISEGAESVHGNDRLQFVDVHIAVRLQKVT